MVYNRKTFHCWACGASGDVINFIRDKYNLDFYAAAEKLADELNVDLTKDPKYAARKQMVNKKEYAAKECQKNVKVVLDYLKKKRGLTDETIKEFTLGADKNGNVSIPFYDVNGRCVGGAIRRFEGMPKYLTNKNDDVFTKAEFLYNLRGAKSKLTNTLYMIEGFFCAMSLHQCGSAAVAYNTSQPSKQQLVKIEKLHETYPDMTVVLIPDNDGVAYPLVTKVRKNALKYSPHVPYEVLLLPDGIKDVNDFFVAGHTLEEFEDLERVPIDLFVLKELLNGCSSEGAERKVVESFAKSVADDIMMFRIAEYLSKRWDMEKKVVEDFLHVSKQDLQLDEDFKDADQCLQETIKMLKEPSVQYGLTTLDAGLRGAGRRKDVTIIGAYSSCGKTWWAIQMATDMVVRQGKNVLFFSMEMSAGALYERVIASCLGKSTDIVDKMILAGDPLVYNLLGKLKEHLIVVDKNGLDIAQVDARVKAANTKIFDGFLDVVIIDYLQYMKGCSQYEVVAETAKGMKPLAKDNDIHVILLSQLNRGNRIWEKPSMADLKGGGDVEASADNILLMWRPGKDPALGPEEFELKKDTIMMGIGKARNGSKIEEIELKMDPATSRILLV